VTDQSDRCLHCGRETDGDDPRGLCGVCDGIDWDCQRHNQRCFECRKVTCCDNQNQREKEARTK
jgi:hypothetical protein